MSALSRTDRVSGPVVPSACHRCGFGDAETLPRCGFRPKSPQFAAGMRIDPPPSPPRATGTSPAATAAADPPEEPPGVLDWSWGLRVTPYPPVWVKGHAPNSGIRVVPMMTAPASRSSRTTRASAAAGVLFARVP
jgi:hypothetical protein